MKYLKAAGVVIVFLLLTVLTQVGGLIYLISLLISIPFSEKFSRTWSKFLCKALTFLVLYIMSVFIFIPIAAKPFGRVQLPLFRKHNLQPVTVLTFLLSRNYVRPQLRETAQRVSERIGKDFPGMVVNYLDAGFPFIDGFPLMPHLSHNDGKKLDFAFAYRDRETQAITNNVPSAIGYGVCESPRENEENTPENCTQNGYWQYSLLQRIVPQGEKNKFDFDEARTKRLVTLFATESAMERVFIEPHLKVRLGLTNPKILFHGCHAVRHDDHFHVQIK